MTRQSTHCEGGGAFTCVLVSDRPWNKTMGDSLAERTGCRFVLISDPAALTAAKLAPIQPRFVFFPHWSHRIDPSVHERFECVIFHMTDLPFGRGGSPLQNLIARGIYETKITALRCVEELDAGPVVADVRISLAGDTDSGDKP